MKVLLLAAGRSKRMHPMPDKIFLEFLGVPLIGHQLTSLCNAGFNDVLIVGGAHNLSELKSVAEQRSTKDFVIHVVEQKDLELGMAGAILSATEWIGGAPFVVMSSNDVLDESAYTLFQKKIDEIHSHKNSDHHEGAMLAIKVTSYFPGGYLKVNKENQIEEIIEKPGEGSEPSDLVNIVLHYHPDSAALIEALEKSVSSRDDRYEVALQSLFSSGKKYVAVAYDGFWQPVKYPWHVITLMDYFLRSVKSFKGKNVTVAPSATLNGEVYLDDGVRVLDNAVITGPAYIGKNAVVATNALVRGANVGAGCVVGFGSEVARSFLGSDVWLHTNYVGDSIIGNDVSFGAGTVTGNLRFDEGPVHVSVQGEKISSHTHKLGLITGDHIRTGINTSFMPGVKIGSNSCIGAGLVIGQDIEDNSFVTGETSLKIHKNKVQILPRKK